MFSEYFESNLSEEWGSAVTAIMKAMNVLAARRWKLLSGTSLGLVLDADVFAARHTPLVERAQESDTISRWETVPTFIIVCEMVADIPHYGK